MAIGFSAPIRAGGVRPGSLAAGSYNILRDRNGNIIQASPISLANAAQAAFTPAGPGPSPQDEAMAARERAEGILDPNQVLQDSAFTRAESALTRLMDQGGPLSEEIQNLIAGKASDSFAARANTQRQLLNEQMARQGGNPNDPAFMAQQRAIEGDRMAANAGSRRDIAIQAALENFGAQQQLADQLRGLGASRQGLANPLRAQLASRIFDYNFGDPGPTSYTAPRPANFGPPVAYNAPGQQAASASSGMRTGKGANNWVLDPLTGRMVDITKASPTDVTRLLGTSPTLLGEKANTPGTVAWSQANGLYDKPKPPPLAGASVGGPGKVPTINAKPGSGWDIDPDLRARQQGRRNEMGIYNTNRTYDYSPQPDSQPGQIWTQFDPNQFRNRRGY